MHSCPSNAFPLLVNASISSPYHAMLSVQTQYTVVSFLHLHPLLPLRLLHLPQIPQKIAPLEILIRMHNRLQLSHAPALAFLSPRYLPRMRILKHPIACHMELLLLLVLFHAPQYIPILYARRLE